MKRKFVLISLLTISALIFCYPFISDYFYQLEQKSVIDSYESKVQELSDDDIDNRLKQAEEYNPFGVKSVSFLTVGNVLGYITIPKIGVLLPIYEGSSEEILNIGIGHIKETSLPVGGSCTHCVLSGHNGMTKQKFFDELDKLVIGDEFYITILNKELTYRVNQIKTVSPTDSEDLQIENGKDYVTLLTCTPRGINTHRLLVRGERAA
ncbi:MAG: class C sortase [Acutalibacteraceae bacterium]